MFHSYYDQAEDKAKPISDLVKLFEKEGNTHVKAECAPDTAIFTADEWNAFTEEEQQSILLDYRLTYISETEVNWCAELGTF